MFRLAHAFAIATAAAVTLLTSPAVGQGGADARPEWLAPGKGDIRIRFEYAAASPSPCVLVVGDTPAVVPLGKALGAKGITTASLAAATRESLPTAHGLLQMHAGELAIDAKRLVLVAVGDGAAAAMDFVHEQNAKVAGFVLLDTGAPVVEGLRADVPVRVVTSGGADAFTQAIQRELAHQSALAGATVVWQRTDDAVADVVAFCTARLLPPPDDTDAVDVAWELAHAAGERRDVAAVSRWLDRALAREPSWSQRLGSDGGSAAVRGEEAFDRYIRERAPAGALQLVGAAEPGLAMHVSCRFVDAAGKPLAATLVDVWQTDAFGVYSHRRNVAAPPRLAASVRTDAQGAFVLHSIRPAGYPTTMIPAHVHLRVHAATAREVELLFADDPRLSPAIAEQWMKRGYGIVQLDAKGGGVAEFRPPAAR
jgi:protocatechuate 3,4-dioxygenase beta subunit